MASETGEFLGTDFELEIRRISGVKQAKVIGSPQPTEIHVVAAAGRSPKQIVRDIQSLAQAGYSLQIDHRIVSVVQIEQDGEADAAAAVNGSSESTVIESQDEPTIVQQQRVVLLDGITVTSRSDSSLIEVSLRWADGEVTQGSSTCGSTREARARASVAATVRALEPVLQRSSTWVDIDQVLIQRVLEVDVVLVTGGYFTGSGGEARVVGAAILHDDAASAGARALLDSISRRLTLTNPNG